VQRSGFKGAVREKVGSEKFHPSDPTGMDENSPPVYTLDLRAKKIAKKDRTPLTAVGAIPYFQFAIGP
jgi:hypothetical protein